MSTDILLALSVSDDVAGTVQASFPNVVPNRIYSDRSGALYRLSRISRRGYCLLAGVRYKGTKRLKRPVKVVWQAETLNNLVEVGFYNVKS